MSEMDFYVPIREGKREEPETLYMALQLDCDPDLVVGKLVRFWTWVGKRSTDGRLPGVTVPVIDAAVQCPGFADGMLSEVVGWLVRDEDGTLVCPDWERMNGKCAARRSAEAKDRRRREADRKRKERGKGSEQVSRPAGVRPVSADGPRTVRGNQRLDTHTDTHTHTGSVEKSRENYLNSSSSKNQENIKRGSCAARAREMLDEAKRVAGEIVQRVNLRKGDEKNRLTAWKVAVLDRARMPEAWLAKAIESVDEKRKVEGAAWEAWGYLWTCLEESAVEAYEVRFQRLLARIPDWTCPARGSPVSDRAVAWMAEQIQMKEDAA